MSDQPSVLEQPIQTGDDVRRFFREVAPWQQMRWGTERVELLLQRLNRPTPQQRFVTIGGTNAKGSTTLYLAALLRAMGHRVGATLSPHISDLTERIHLGGAFIPVPALIRACERLRQARRDWPAGESPGTPTYHELWTAAAIEAFAAEGCAWGILEVGMGGRYDAARAVTPVAALLTPVGLDHMQFLGNTLEAIATEKVQIFPPQGLVVTARQAPGVRDVISSHVATLGATWLAIEEEVTLTLSAGPSPVQPRFDYRSRDWELQNLSTGLKGRYQTENAALALLTIQGLVAQGALPTLPDEAVVRDVLRRVTPALHPARFELLSESPPLWCEGGHNPPALEAFVEEFLQLGLTGPLELLIGFKWDKDVPAALQTLARLRPSAITVTESHQVQPRPAAAVAQIVREQLPGVAIHVEPDSREAARYWKERVWQQTGAAGLVIGSLYLCGDIRRYIVEGALGVGPWLVPPFQLPEKT